MSNQLVDRSMAGLRDSLFTTLEGLQNGSIDARTGSAIAGVANTILKSAEVQINFEKLKLLSEVPGVLPSMPLKPLLLGNQASGAAGDGNE